jgi:3-oxoacyl-[acyl-carrier-protein] synthase II
VAITADGDTDTSLSSTHLTAEVPEKAYRKHIDPAYARRVDQLGRFVLSAVRLGLVDSGYTLNRETRERVGMVFGTCTGPMETIAKLTETIGTSGPDRVNPRLFPNSVMNAAPGHACLSLQLRGPLSTLATGCASGLTALVYAADLVRDGAADAMFAVSADELTPMLHLGIDKLGLLASDEVRLYDRDASGFAVGQGGVALVVESLDSAQARGATILAEVVGHAITADGWRIAGNAQDGVAWAESFRRAMDDAGMGPEEIGTVYGDARGTPALDLAEARAIASVWEPGQVRVANLNGQTGHVHGTTPMLAAVCATATVGTGWAPRPAGARDPLPELAAHLAAEAGDDDRACMVTAANWGGTYASVVLRGGA